MPEFQPAAGRRARVRSGRHKGQVAEIISEDDRQPGFWWCKVHDTSGHTLVLREKLIGAGQLEEGGQADG